MSAGVYFVQGELGGPVKIGFSQSPEKRVAGIQTGFPWKLKTLLILPGPKQLEAELHSKFADCRLSGEWFEVTPKLRHFIESQGAEAYSFAARASLGEPVRGHGLVLHIPVTELRVRPDLGPLTAEEQAVLDALSHRPVPAKVLVARHGFASAQLSRILLRLRRKGRVLSWEDPRNKGLLRWSVRESPA